MAGGGGGMALSQPSSNPWKEAWVTDGPVYSICHGQGTTFIGGDFSYVGPYTGGGVPVDSSSGHPVSAFPRVNGEVRCVVPDGSGGWFIGGSFTRAGSSERRCLAHVDSSGQVTSFNPQVEGTVYAVARSGGILYLAGAFSSVGGQARSNIAAVDASSGSLITGFNPGVDGTVYAMAASPDGGTLYIGGFFNSVGGESRENLAALALPSGAPGPLNPQPYGTVYALALSPAGSVLYLGGSFLYLAGSGVQRSRLAALDTASGGSRTSTAPPAAPS